MTFTLRNKAGVYSLNSYSLSSPLGALDPNYLQLPQNDISDNQVIFAGVSGGLTYRLSPLLSLNIGAAGTLVRRQPSALYGMTGAVARGDLEYRISLHSTVGADYRYMYFDYFDYTRGFGNSDIHSVGINYSTQISPARAAIRAHRRRACGERKPDRGYTRPGDSDPARRVGGHSGRLSPQLRARHASASG